MKGAILGIARTARQSVDLIDVTHEVAPHDVTEGALALEAAAPWFPASTVHVAVVDPGVGTSRRGLAVVARDQVFIGPDNGLFTPFVGAPGWRAFELRASQYRLPSVSATFHGRDVFAPAAAHVALGVDPALLGPPVADPVLLPWPEARSSDGAVAGAVVHVDRFGNLVTSIRVTSLSDLRTMTVRVSGRPVDVVSTYGDLDAGRVGALVGSSGRLEIAVREGSAAAALRAQRGTRVTVSPTSAAPASTRSSRVSRVRSRRRP
jgi:S-adenosylmethionine hydrolase